MRFRFNYRFMDDCLSLFWGMLRTTLLFATLPSSVIEASEFCLFMWARGTQENACTWCQRGPSSMEFMDFSAVFNEKSMVLSQFTWIFSDLNDVFMEFNEPLRWIEVLHAFLVLAFGVFVDVLWIGVRQHVYLRFQ